MNIVYGDIYMYVPYVLLTNIFMNIHLHIHTMNTNI